MHTKHIADYQIRVCVNKKGGNVHGEQENQLEMNKYGIFVHPGDIIGYLNVKAYVPGSSVCTDEPESL